MTSGASAKAATPAVWSMSRALPSGWGRCDRHSGARQRVRAKRGPMTGSARTSDVQLHIGESRAYNIWIPGPREDACPGMTRLNRFDKAGRAKPVSYTHLRAHETRHDIVCRLLLEKK